MQACLPGIDCSVPTNSDIVAPHCALFPNDPICQNSSPSGAITPSNWGDFGDEDLCELASVFNSGLCFTTELDDEQILGDIVMFPRGRPRPRGPQNVGRDQNGNCNACPSPTVTCRQDLFAPIGRSRVGHLCSPTDVGQLHIETLSWYGPVEENGQCMCYPILNEVVHCLKRLTDMIALRLLCPGGVRVNFG